MDNSDYNPKTAEKIMECYLSDRPETLYRTPGGEYFFLIQKNYNRKKEIEGEEFFIASFEDEILPIESKDQIKDWFDVVLESLD